MAGPNPKKRMLNQISNEKNGEEFKEGDRGNLTLEN
jgi:hypothetical protein